jgi:hypothetical protein
VSANGFGGQAHLPAELERDPAHGAGGGAHVACLVADGDRRVRGADRRGRVVPELTHGARWPWRVLGIAYGLIAVAVLVIGGIRQSRTADALRRGSYDELSGPLVLYLTAAAVILSLGAVILVAIRV